MATINRPPRKLVYATPPLRWEPEMGWALFVLAIALGCMMFMGLLFSIVAG